MDCKVIDNFLPQDIFNNIQELLISDKFGWFYCNAVGNPLDDEDDFIFIIFLKMVKFIVYTLKK